MATDITLIDQTKPEWLKRSLAAIKGDYFSPTITESLSLTEQQRKFVQSEIQHIKNLENDVSEIESSKIITRLLNAFPSQAASPAAVADRNEAYLIAIENVPVWAIEAAYRSWIKGDHKEKNYTFAPSPPQLRKIAAEKWGPVVSYRRQLEALLNAKEEKEYSPEYRKNMLERIRGLFWQTAEG